MTQIGDWRRMVLKSEGLSDWTVKLAADGYCWRHLKVIQIRRRGAPSGFLHEVAHALHPEPEGEHKNHYHGGGWADAFGRLIDKYMRPRDQVYNSQNKQGKRAMIEYLPLIPLALAIFAAAYALG